MDDLISEQKQDA
ncbi:hypothetical protein ALT785_660005 [Alteromonas infernus]